MQLLRQFNTIVLRVAGWTVMISMAAIAIIIPYEVFGRYVLGNMSTWTNEFTQYALVWASMLGGAVGLKRGYQVGITSLTDSLPPGPSRFVQALSFAAMLVFLAFMTYYGGVQMLTNRFQTSSTIGIPMSIPYSALPIGFLIMFFVTLEQLIDLFSASTAGGR